MDDVRTYEGHHVGVFAGGEDQFVLTEHASSDDSEDCRELSLDQPIGKGCNTPSPWARRLHLLGELALEGLHQMAETCDVSFDPLLPPDDDGGRVAREVEPGGRRDEIRHLFGDSGHVRLERGSMVGLGQGVGPCDPSGETARAGPAGSHSLTIRYRLRTTLVKYWIVVMTMTKTARTIPVGIMYR